MTCATPPPSASPVHRWQLLLPVYAALLILLLLTSTTPVCNARTSTATSLCPRCPLCARSSTSLTQRLKYCHSSSSYALAFFSRGGSKLAAAAGRPALSNGNENNHRQQRQRYPLELPFTTDDEVRQQCMRDATDLLVSRVRGQPQVVKPLIEVLRRKLVYPKEPVVVHLAGDNGVGKTHTARLVSLALSLRCATDRDVCDAGDSLLTIAGTGFDGLSIAEARARIVRQVAAHAARFPHGVVLIDDVTAMDPDLVTALAPLFGRASHFPEQLTGDLEMAAADEHHLGSAHPHSKSHGSTQEKTTKTAKAATAAWSWRSPLSFSSAATASATHGVPPPPLSQLLLFITTDFGRQGRTVGKSHGEIEALVQADFAELYGTLLPAYTRTFVFFPFTTRMAEGVVRGAVADLPCTLGEHLIASSWISDEAVSFLVEQQRAMWAGKENGHALRRLVEDELVSQLIVYWEVHGVQERLRVRFELDEASVRVLMRLPSKPGREEDDGAATYFPSPDAHDL